MTHFVSAFAEEDDGAEEYTCVSVAEALPFAEKEDVDLVLVH